MLHELAETVRQRALVVVISDLFVDPSELRGCSSTCGFRRHDLALSHLLDPKELSFDFRRPMRFLDMEGGPAIFARAERDRRSLPQGDRRYLEESRRPCAESAVDYHQVGIDDDYEQVLLPIPGRPGSIAGGALR